MRVHRLSPCDPVGECVGRSTVGALAGIAAGGLVGVAVMGGIGLLHGSGFDDGGPALAAVIGAIGGAAIGMPVGVHVGNRRRGSLLADALAAAASMGGAAYLVGRSESGNGGWTIPLAGVASVVAAEVLTARAR